MREYGDQAASLISSIQTMSLFFSGDISVCSRALMQGLVLWNSCTSSLDQARVMVKLGACLLARLLHLGNSWHTRQSQTDIFKN
jgi:hypothetical protein